MENIAGKFTIKEFSEKTGIPSTTLRYYEKENLIPSIRRGGNGHRIYDENDLEWINIICCLKNTDMPLHEMREFVSLSMEGDSTLSKRLAIVLAHKERVNAQLDELKQHLERIEYKANYLSAACEVGTERGIKQQWYPKCAGFKSKE
jgi:Predicted transcriptional regulators